MGAIAIYSSGMVTGVGLDAPSSCAAIRAGITGFTETRFMFDGEWLQGCPVVLEEPWRGVEKLGRMAAAAVGECLTSGGVDSPTSYPLLLCTAETDRPGRISGLGESFLHRIGSTLGISLHPDSRLVETGRVAGIEALDVARQFVADGAPGCIIAGVDSFLTATTLRVYQAQRRLVTPEHPDGFIPGEAAAAVLVGPVRRSDQPQLLCMGVGFGRDLSTPSSEIPMRADGLVDALRECFDDARCSYSDIDFRITDINGESRTFKDAALLVARTMRDLKEEFDLWHPADCTGEIGAAIVPLAFALMLAACEKSYAPGLGALCHFSADDGRRAMAILQYRSWRRD